MEPDNSKSQSVYDENPLVFCPEEWIDKNIIN